MKKIISAIFLSFLLVGARAQDQRGADLNHCLSSHPVAQSLVKPYLEQFHQLQAQIEADVRSLIAAESIRNSGQLLSFQNLASVVRTADLLQQYDKRYDEFFATTTSSLASAFATQQLCMNGMEPGAYREAVLDFLEYEVFRPQDDFASTTFANLLQFESALIKMNGLESKWLASAGDELSGEYPGFDQPVQEEFYWSVLNQDFDLSLTDPEPALQQLAGTGREKKKFKDILQFIFNNWTEIKGILDWLNNNLFYDCSPSVTSRIRLDKEDLPHSFSPSLRRQFRYAVSQNGVLMDGKSTRTRIKARLKLYKKRPVGWARDKVSMAGINYCSLQWNACEEIPWPANGVPFYQAPNNQPFKTRLNQQHPYALTIRDVSYEFLTFKLFYNQQAIKTIYLLGSGDCD